MLPLSIFHKRLWKYSWCPIWPYSKLSLKSSTLETYKATPFLTLNKKAVCKLISIQAQILLFSNNTIPSYKYSGYSVNTKSVSLFSKWLKNKEFIFLAWNYYFKQTKNNQVLFTIWIVYMPRADSYSVHKQFHLNAKHSIWWHPHVEVVPLYNVCYCAISNIRF